MTGIKSVGYLNKTGIEAPTLEIPGQHNYKRKPWGPQKEIRQEKLNPDTTPYGIVKPRVASVLSPSSAQIDSYGPPVIQFDSTIVNAMSAGSNQNPGSQNSRPDEDAATGIQATNSSVNQSVWPIQVYEIYEKKISQSDLSPDYSFAA